MSQLLDTSALLTNYMNSRITNMLFNRLYGEDSPAALPESTRRAFTSRMRLDSRVALQGAQNMEDAAAMVTVAQTDITGIKDKLNQMRDITAEAMIKEGMTAADYQTARENLRGLAKGIVGLAETSSFNGIRLLDGSAGMDRNGRIELQAGNSSFEQVLTNVLDGSVGNTVLERNGTGINLRNLEKRLDEILADNEIADPADLDKAAEAFAEANGLLAGVFDRIQGIEAQYSYDIKSLDNMKLLLLGQADILDNVVKNHQTDATDGEGASATTTSSSSALSDLLNGTILSAVS